MLLYIIYNVIVNVTNYKITLTNPIAYLITQNWINVITLHQSAYNLNITT